MASIRPMAVSTPPQPPPPVTTTAVVSQSQTPTATVHPTTQESDSQQQQPLHVTTQAAAAAQRPTQPVQALSPHVDEPLQVAVQPDGEYLNVIVQRPTVSTSISSCCV